MVIKYVVTNYSFWWVSTQYSMQILNYKIYKMLLTNVTAIKNIKKEKEFF